MVLTSYVTGYREIAEVAAEATPWWVTLLLSLPAALFGLVAAIYVGVVTRRGNRDLQADAARETSLTQQREAVVALVVLVEGWERLLGRKQGKIANEKLSKQERAQAVNEAEDLFAQNRDRTSSAAFRLELLATDERLAEVARKVAEYAHRVEGTHREWAHHLVVRQLFEPADDLTRRLGKTPMVRREELRALLREMRVLSRVTLRPIRGTPVV